jgi:hypothetical protein
MDVHIFAVKSERFSKEAASTTIADFFKAWPVAHGLSTSQADGHVSYSLALQVCGAAMRLRRRGKQPPAGEREVICDPGWYHYDFDRR